MAREYRLYGELAPWWPLISPPADYAADARAVAAAFATAARPVRTVLDLGSGGGGMAVHLQPGRELTLVDISPAMLAVSRALNPACEHVAGDMRTLRLGRQFDAVLVHDAVDYVTDEAALAEVVATAREHCAPGGVAVFAPDHTAERFAPGAGAGGGRDASGAQASFTERTSDPDPDDDWILAEYEFTLRDAAGRVQVVTEAHRLGCFSRPAWLRLLEQAGFSASAAEPYGPGAPRRGRILFTAARPA